MDVKRLKFIHDTEWPQSAVSETEQMEYHEKHTRFVIATAADIRINSSLTHVPFLTETYYGMLIDVLLCASYH